MNQPTAFISPSAETQTKNTRKLVLTVVRDCLFVFLIIVLVAALYIQYRKMEAMTEEFRKDSDIKTRQIQRLDAGIEFQSKRSKFLTIARDSIIRKHNRGVSSADAFSIAEFVLYVCEKYSLNPVLLFAIGRQESRFEQKAVSEKKAVGLFQIHPLTGRVLCDVMGIEYHPKLLFDMKTNSIMAGKYLDYLRAEYADIELMLIGYNAGPKWADRFRANKKVKLPEETQRYVAAVQKYYVEFNQKLAFYLPGTVEGG